MSQYFDAIVIPVPRANLETYKRMSAEWGAAHLRHGALYYSDSISDDAQPGKVTSFPQAVQLKDGEVIARIRSSRNRWTPRRCPSTASACSGVASRPSLGSRRATKPATKNQTGEKGNQNDTQTLHRNKASGKARRGPGVPQHVGLGARERRERLRQRQRIECSGRRAVT